ncbi:hypothetical protein [Moraxella sp. VT-16-12]|uniref:hypothetical protein n=1 Tax=Moraxella sp. VT-16-12 TaxID=2014877 RepID=UPI0021031B39|nr:hypothetical protein [Moraxella sp. VT-16-12]
MRYLSVFALICGMSAHAMLPNPTTDTVSYTANPIAKPNAPTLNVSANTATTNALGTQTADDSADFISVVNAFVVKSNNGVETLIPVTLGTAVQAGDVLEYQGLFTNTGDRVRKMDVTLSIADGLELVGGVMPQHASASMDGNRFVRMPIRVKGANGQVQNLPLSDYKALRWTIEDVGLGGTAVVKYRAKIK